MRDRLYYFFTSKVFIITSIVIVLLSVIGFGVWGGVKYFKKDDKQKEYFSVSGYFKDENNQIFVDGVEIIVGDTVKGFSITNGKFEIKYLENGSVLSFAKADYSFTPSSITVDRNISDIFIDAISTKIDLTKTFQIKITDVNKLPLNDVSVVSDKKVLGRTDSQGIFELSLTEGQKKISFSHTYYRINDIIINYDDTDLNINLTATFDLNSYLYYTDSEGQQQTRSFTTGFTFRTNDGRLINNGKIYYKIKNEDVFRFTNGYSIVFENKVFETVFAYAYDTVTNNWICSDLLKTSKLGGNIYLDDAVHISAKIDSPRGTVFTSSGYYFLADEYNNIEVVIKAFSGETFFKEMEYGYPKYQLQLLDENENIVTSINKSIDNCVFKVK